MGVVGEALCRGQGGIGAGQRVDELRVRKSLSSGRDEREHKRVSSSVIAFLCGNSGFFCRGLPVENLSLVSKRGSSCTSLLYTGRYSGSGRIRFWNGERRLGLLSRRGGDGVTISTKSIISAASELKLEVARYTWCPLHLIIRSRS